MVRPAMTAAGHCFYRGGRKIKDSGRGISCNLSYYSTAVENLKAKPIIDMMPVVRDIAQVDQYNQGIAIGYEPKGEFGITGERYFRKGSEVRTHQIHFCAEQYYTREAFSCA